jgi:hypothetical protein
VVVGVHEKTHPHMEDNTKLEDVDGVSRQLMVECFGLLVVLGKQYFVGPVDDEIVDAADWIENWHSA